MGAKSLGAYGGYETFVYKLTEYHQNHPNIKYHVACKANGDGCMDETKIEGVTRISDREFEFHNARCFKIRIPQIGPAQAIYYDVAALRECCSYIRKHRIPHPIVYIMACRIGPFAGHYYKEIHRLGGRGCPVKPWIISRLFLYPGLLFTSAELAGQRGGGDMAAGVHGIVLPDGAWVPDASERLYVLDIQEISPTGKGEDLFQIVIVKIVDHGGRPLLLCRDC